MPALVRFCIWVAKVLNSTSTCLREYYVEHHSTNWTNEFLEVSTLDSSGSYTLWSHTARTMHHGIIDAQTSSLSPPLQNLGFGVM
jgi:hypothetical protein